MKRKTFLASLVGLAIAPSVVIPKEDSFKKHDTPDVDLNKMGFDIPGVHVLDGKNRIISIVEAGENIPPRRLITFKNKKAYLCDGGIALGVSKDKALKGKLAKIIIAGVGKVECIGI